MYRILIMLGIFVSASASVFLEFSNSNCTDKDFVCDNLQCIPMSKHCDGNKDCSDSTDEEDCEMFLCTAPDFFRCKNMRCLSSFFRCDGGDDCEDFSDEENCPSMPQVNRTCTKAEWQCVNKMCIPQEFACNGELDCADGSDEIQGCSGNIHCDGFKCKNGHCIPEKFQCDGEDDCDDKSDELDCDVQIDPKECTLEKQRFLCGDAKTCIKLSEVCDGKQHCPDKSDEEEGCKTSCGSCSHHCIHLPTGAKCLCPKGYSTIDDNHCEDIDECNIFGICDQKCKNLPGSYECFCDENYSLQADNKSCKAHSGEATMFFSTRKEIRAYLLRSEVYFPVAKNLRQVVGVDYDGHYVYWTDIFAEHESIVRSTKDGKQKELLVTSGLGSPEDLHVDHITGNIYFTDAERQHIGVCANDGIHCTVLVNKDVQKPRGIVLYPEQGEMYWTDWGRNPGIVRAFMDGSNATSFVSVEIHWPNGLALDKPNGRLYWTDARIYTLESINLDGTDRRVVLEGVVRHPYAIAVFEGRLFWSDWSSHSIQACDKFTGKNHHTLFKEKDYIYGISIYHPNQVKVKENPCFGTLCGDICLLSGTKKYTCACAEGRILGVTGYKCKNVEKRQRIVLGIGDLLVQVDHKILGKHEVEVLEPAVKKVGAMAYNGKKNVLYISDADIKKIVAVSLHSGDAELLSVQDLGDIAAMDYDYLGNNLYWCDSTMGTVEVLNLNTNSRKILLHDMHGEIPEAIALIPEEGVMFVSFRKLDNSGSHVDRILMDGSSRTHPLESGLLGPVSLSYDEDLHRVFVADAGTGNLESTSADGDDRHGFRSLQASPVGITTLKKDVFWVEANSWNLYWADKHNTGENDFNRRITLDFPGATSKIHIVSITPQRIGLSPCQSQNGNCSHLCLHSLKSIVCACPSGLALHEDRRTCIKRMECGSGEFRCFKSNTCILKKLRCDGTKNCLNGEDEDDCKIPHHCPLSDFQCQDGECVKEVLRCDGRYDCRDKSDEHGCNHVETGKCPPKQVRCRNDKCIWETFVCDGIKHCQDGYDEDNCPLNVCTDEQFRCQSGACIPKFWECDHDYDCRDSSDEHSGCASCKPTMFVCTNGKCIHRSFVCDGENDCGDNSDENNNCKKPKNSCDQGEFSCSLHTHICLPHNARCNGTSECPHKEDERDCSDCHVDEFTCANKKCISTQWICDRSDDCGDNSDEAPSLCSHEKPSHTVQGSCNDGYQCKNGACIDSSLVCNGKADCYDGSDEEGVCSTSCSAMNNPCSQICLQTPTGPACKCHKGFQLGGDGHTCQDINECQNHPPVCSQLCHNILGSFSCDCYDEFIIRADQTSCKAQGRAMSLIFTLDNEIRELSQMENALKLIHSEDGPKISGLDAVSRTGSIYFSVETSGVIVKINSNNSNKEYMEETGLPQQLAVDWITNNIYYVNNDPKSKSISICNFHHKVCSSLIPVDIHRRITAIAVDPINKHLFFSVVTWWLLNSPSYIIYKTNLDGTGRQELLKGTSGYVTGLTYDLHKKEIFFVDQHQGQLGSVNYDGTDKKALVSNLTRPVGLSFFENHVFFLTSGGYMGKCRLFEPTTCDSFKFNRYSNDLFTIVQESRQPNFVKNVCEKHNCSHLCVPAKVGYQCLCEDGKLAAPTEECNSIRREGDPRYDQKVMAAYHYRVPSGSKTGAVIAGVLISICLVALGIAAYYFIKKKNSGNFNISVRFHNPVYGMPANDPEKSILEPEQHEYTNPGAFYDV